MTRCLTGLVLLVLTLPYATLAQDDMWSDEGWDDEEVGGRWSGFAEIAVGGRLHRDPLISSDSTLQDLRLRAESQWQPGPLTISLKADGRYDGIENGWDLDVRELTAAFALGRSLDVKAGRQVQTWGTGDLVFLNDLFPKDFVSFFAGRDDDYLKAPGDALRLSYFSDAVNIDLVWTPVFQPDVFLTGERFSFFFPPAGENIAPATPLPVLEPDEKFSNGEFALRLFSTVNGREYALYAYRGYFKQPTALTPNLRPAFAPMSALGASLRQPLGGGLVNLETSYYLSNDDRNGADPFVPNDQFRLLAGYEWEARANFSVGLQYYLEWTQDHDALLANSPFPQLEPEEFRHLLTNRLTLRSSRGRHTWSLFTFWSPSDQDMYFRPAYTFRQSDQWSFAVGANVFAGEQPQTFFSQLTDASNVYVRARYSY